MGIVFDIQRFALHDGPGIRTTVFLKGCPLQCVWCHNPESRCHMPQIAFDAERCIQCGACLDVCQQNVHELLDGRHLVHFDRCITAGACVEACDQQALKIIGREMTVGEVLAEVERDRTYYERSGGGLTLSGGEPLAQPDFAAALLREAQSRGLHTCLDTCGVVARHRLAAAADHVDLVLFDYKATKPEVHRALTGVSNDLVLENLAYLLECDVPVVLRCPLVPGVNDSVVHLAGIADLAACHPELQAVEIMPFHNMGRAKAARIGETNLLADVPTASEMQQEEWLAVLHGLGCEHARLG